MTNSIESGLVIRRVGSESQSAISTLPAIGNVVVRACQVFAEVKEEGGNDAAVEFCREYCPLRELSVTEYRNSVQPDCPEKNTLDAYERLGIKPEEAITVAVTGNNVGFSDRFDEYIEEGVASTNPEGWREAKGFNSFFVDTSEGTTAIGRRLADCGDLNIEFKTKDGRTIIGFMHLTRPSQTTGKGEYRFGEPDAPTSYVEYALREGLEHFGEVDVSTLSLSLRTAIEAQDFIKHFNSDEAMESNLPGWFDDGFLENIDNPNWQLGDEHDPNDTWYADFKGIILRDIREALDNLGINESQLDIQEMLNTMNNPEHSSYERAKREGKLDTRDLYVTLLKKVDIA